MTTEFPSAPGPQTSPPVPESSKKPEHLHDATDSAATPPLRELANTQPALSLMAHSAQAKPTGRLARMADKVTTYFGKTPAHDFVKGEIREGFKGWFDNFIGIVSGKRFRSEKTRAGEQEHPTVTPKESEAETEPQGSDAVAAQQFFSGVEPSRVTSHLVDVRHPAARRMSDNRAMFGLTENAPPQLTLQHYYDNRGTGGGTGQGACWLEFNIKNPGKPNLLDLAHPTLHTKLFTVDAEGYKTTNHAAWYKGTFIDAEVIQEYLDAVKADLVRDGLSIDKMSDLEKKDRFLKGVPEFLRPEFKECVNWTALTVKEDKIPALQKLVSEATQGHTLSDDSIQTSDVEGICGENRALIDAICADPTHQDNIARLRTAVAQQFVRSYQEDPNKTNRGHGESIKKTVASLAANPSYLPPYEGGISGSGCGAAMRSGPLGRHFAGEDNREALILQAIQISAITHPNPLAIVGGIGNALITSLIYEDVPFAEWEARLAAACSEEKMNYAMTLLQVPDDKKEAFKLQWKQALEVIQLGHDLLQDPPFTLPTGQKLDDTPEGRQAFLMQLVELKHGTVPHPHVVDGELQGARNPADYPISSRGDWPGRSGHDVTAGAIYFFRLAVTSTQQLSGGPITRPSELREALAANPKLATHINAEVDDKAAKNNNDSDSFAGIVGGWLGACLGSDHALSGLPENEVRDLKSNVYR